MGNQGQSFYLKLEILLCSWNSTFGSCFHFVFSLSFHSFNHYYSIHYARCYSSLFSVAKGQLLYSWPLQIVLNSDTASPLPSLLNALQSSKLGSRVRIHSCQVASVPIY
jgi:hypothetical protein